MKKRGRDFAEKFRRRLLALQRRAYEAGFARGLETQASHDMGHGEHAMTMAEGWREYLKGRKA